MKLGDGVYLARCLSGHMFAVEPGGDLEKRCARRVAQGAIDAFILEPNECIDCIEDTRALNREMSRMIDLLGCPLNSCAQACSCLPPHEILDSFYSTQLRRLPSE